MKKKVFLIPIIFLILFGLGRSILIKISDPEIEYELLENTDQCLGKCYLRFRIKFDKNFIINTNDKFTSKFIKSVKSDDLLNYGYRIRKNQTYNIIVSDYGKKEFCRGELNQQTLKNETICENKNVQIGSHQEERWRYEWIDFDPVGETFIVDEWYYIELWGKRNPKMKSNNIDAIPVINGFELPFAWWNSSWDKKRNFTITINDQRINYDNYFMNVSFNVRNEINDGDIKPDCSDIRLVDNIGNELDYKLIGCNSTDTRLWFNFTNATPTTTDYQIFYSNPSASKPIDYNFSHWYIGDDFDQYLNNTLPWPNLDNNDGIWDVNVENAGWSHSGTPSGNKSLRKIGSDGGTYKTWAGIVGGKAEIYFNVTTTSGSDNDFLYINGPANNFAVYFLLSTAGYCDGFCMYSNNAWLKIFTPSMLTEYHLSVEWDTDVDKLNYTIRTGTSTVASANNVPFGRVNTALTHVRGFFAVSGADYFLDDLIVRNTQGVYNEPSSIMGNEESAPPTDTCTPPADSEWIIEDACTKTDDVNNCPYGINITADGSLNISGSIILNTSYVYWSAISGEFIYRLNWENGAKVYWSGCT